MYEVGGRMDFEKKNKETVVGEESGSRETTMVVLKAVFSSAVRV